MTDKSDIKGRLAQTFLRLKQDERREALRDENPEAHFHGEYARIFADVATQLQDPAVTDDTLIALLRGYEDEVNAMSPLQNPLIETASAVADILHKTANVIKARKPSP